MKPTLPKPDVPAVFATAENTPSVKYGYEMGGYEKTPPMFNEETIQSLIDEAYKAGLSEHEKDAARYRWLRRQPWVKTKNIHAWGQLLDNAIDGERNDPPVLPEEKPCK